MLQIINKIRLLLNRKQKIWIILLCIMMLFGAFLETLGVGLILPLISAITNPNLMEDNKYVSELCKRLNLQSIYTFIIIMLVVLILIYLLKNIYLFFEYYLQYHFVSINRFFTQNQLLQVYLKRPYEYFLDIDSGEVVRIITEDVNGTFTLLSSILTFFTEGIVSIALFATIIIADPLMAFLLAGILGGIMLVIMKIIKPILKRAGERNQKNSGKVNKWILQAISGIKEVKVEQKEEYFLEQFSQYGRAAVNAEKTYNVLGTVPRLSIEAISISTMLGIIVLLMINGREVSAMLPQMSAFAMAAVRLMPSMNRMSTSLNMIAYQEPRLDKLLEHLTVTRQWEGQDSLDKKIKEERTTKDISLKQSVVLKDITYVYPNSKIPVLSHMDMEIPIGTSVGIVGPSGSGKTTAVDILLGLLLPKKGSVLADGRDVQNNYAEWLSHIGYIPQMIFMLDDTIRANVAFGVSKGEIDESQVWRALEEAQLSEFVQGLPQGLDTSIGERGIRLSGGQRQRIGIARALYEDPELLIFDEATSALDNETETAIMESINSLHGKKTMVIIAHRLGTIKDCDIVYRVENGSIRREQ